MSDLCKYCESSLPPSTVKRFGQICSSCADKLPLARRFGEVCEEFKKRINYEAIKEARKKEAEENDQGTTASV